MQTLVKPMLKCLQDKNKGVRSAAQQCLPYVVRRVGYDKLRKLCADIKVNNGSAGVVRGCVRGGVVRMLRSL